MKDFIIVVLVLLFANVAIIKYYRIKGAIALPIALLCGWIMFLAYFFSRLFNKIAEFLITDKN